MIVQVSIGYGRAVRLRRDPKVNQLENGIFMTRRAGRCEWEKGKVQLTYHPWSLLQHEDGINIWGQRIKTRSGNPSTPLLPSEGAAVSTILSGCKQCGSKFEDSTNTYRAGSLPSGKRYIIIEG